MPMRIIRRAVLCSGVGAATMSFSGGSSATARQSKSDLFVYRAPDNGNLVFAVVVSLVGTRASPAARVGVDKCFHAGVRSRTIKSPERPDSLVFAAEVPGPHTEREATYNAIVLEDPHDFGSAGESLAVWAEIHAEDGSRFRAGSPFIVELLARDGMLLRTSAVHARRFTTRLLPDVMHYQPDFPVGFAFAPQSGRYPAADAGMVTTTILTVAVAARTVSTPFPLKHAFPYFVPSAFAA